MRLFATLTFQGELPKQFNLRKTLEASLSFVGSVPRNMGHGLLATLTGEGYVGKNVFKGLAGTLTFMGSLSPRKVTEIIVQRFEAALSFSGSVGRTIRHQLIAQLKLVASLVLPLPPYVQRFAASVGFSAELQKTIIHRFKAALKFSVHMFFNRFLRFALGPDRLVVRRKPSNVHLVEFLPKEPKADRLVHWLTDPQVIEYAPGTYEEKLSPPADLDLQPVSGLQERDDLPSKFEGDTPLAETNLQQRNNRAVLIERDLAD
jgi:hypothetical protein